MTRSEARANAAERRRSRIKEAGGRILQVALRADGARALAKIEESTGKGPSAIIEELLTQASARLPK